MTEHHSAHWRRLCNAVMAVFVLCVSVPAVSAETPDLLDLSLEQLLSVEITSASRKSQSLSEAAAAVYVISDEAIRASGVRTIPEALRLAPGLQVSRIDGNRWAISARGFNGRFANKLLVMVDGRSVYTSSFAGVYWESLDTLLPDIERIEVVRGPGSSVWGANAVNGVINIITKRARVTQGVLFSANADSLGGNGGAIRYGADAGDNGYFRLFGKAIRRESNSDIYGQNANDHFRSLRIGARYDFERGDDSISVSAEAHDDKVGQTTLLSSFVAPYYTRHTSGSDVRGFFVNSEWSRRTERRGELSVRASIDETDRADALFGEESTKFAIDGQWTLPRHGRHELTVGLGLRRYDFTFAASPFISLQPATGFDNFFSAFVQDEIDFGDGRGHLTAGVKLEHDERQSDDLKLMPTLRASWKLSDSSTVWGSITRSIRTPSYADSNVRIQGLGPAVPPLSEDNPLPVPHTRAFLGSVQVTDETVLAIESGFRWQAVDNGSIDVAVFHNRYDDLRSAAQILSSCEPDGVLLSTDPLCTLTSDHVLNTVYFANFLEATAYGAELAAQWAPREYLRLNAVYSFLDVDFEGVAPNGSRPIFPNARHQWSVRADWVLARGMQLGLWARYTDELQDFDIRANHDLSLIWTWRPVEAFEFSLIGQQLTESDHVEFLSELGEAPPTIIERRAVARLRWLF